MKQIPLLLAVAATVTLACSDSFSPTIENVAGDYTLRTLTTITDTGGTKNWVAAGSTFSLSLHPNGTTSGRLFIPDGTDEPGVDMDADMAGTWTLTSGIIEFDQTADTFVRDVPFRPSKNRLVVDLTSSQGRLIVVLTK